MQRQVRGFVLRTLPVGELKRTTRAEREREAKAYWDSLTPEQEAWAMRKMTFRAMGRCEP